MTPWTVAHQVLSPESACNVRDLGSIPGFDPSVGKIPWRREWQPTPVFLPGEFHEQRSLVSYSPWDCKELDRTERLTLSLSLLSDTPGKPQAPLPANLQHTFLFLLVPIISSFGDTSFPCTSVTTFSSISYRASFSFIILELTHWFIV